MALVISDRVKETTITTGTGTITLGGAFGGFQSFSSTIGNGNTTYYTIENDARWEVGIGTYTSGGNTLSRDTVLASSNSDAKITLNGVSFVFCTLPADRTLFKDSDGIIVSNSGTIGCSGLFTMRKQSAGSFFHAYVDDAYDETIALYSNAASSPQWKLGLKGSPSDVTAAPTYAYIYGEDGSMGLVGSSLNQLNLTHSDGLVIKHKGYDIFKVDKVNGIHINSVAVTEPALTVNGGISLSSDIQRWTTLAGTVLAAIDKDGDLTAKSFTATDGSSSGVIFFNADGVLTSDSSLIYDSSNEYLGIGTDSPDYELDVAGDIGLNQYIYHNGDTNTYIRFRGDQIDFVAGGRTMLTLDEAGTDKVIVNNSKADVDFQVEGDGDQYLIYTNAANDRVGIGTNDPAYKLDVVGSGRMASIIFAGDSTEQTTAYTNQDVLVSGWAASDLTSISGVGGTIDSVSGWADATFIDAGTIPAQILANSASGVVISGIAIANTTAINASGANLMTEIRANSASGIAISGWVASDLTSISGVDGTIDSVSGWVGSTITNEINDLVDAAPGALNTLNELAAALSDDASFSTTVTNLIAATSASGVVISGIAIANTIAINASGNTLLGSINTNSTNIAATGATNAAAIVVNTTAINASGNTLLGSINTNSTNITNNTTAINASGANLMTEIRANSVSGVAISGWAASDLTSISGIGGTIDSVSGWASGTFIEATPTFFHNATNEVLAINTANPETVARCPGDFNADGAVDAADYTIWNNNLGGSSSVLNGNGTGAATVVLGDYWLWKKNFGNTCGGDISLDVNGSVAVSGSLIVDKSVVALNGASSFKDVVITNDLHLMNDLTVHGINTLNFVNMIGQSGSMDQLLLQNRNPEVSGQAFIVRNDVSQNCQPL